MEKSELRKVALRRRAALTQEENLIKSRLICDKLFTLDEYNNADVLLLYKEYNNEVSTELIFEHACMKGKIIAYPVSRVSNGISHMEFKRVTSKDDFVIGYKGIWEPDSDKCINVIPTEKTLMIMPGAAFDYELNRIGYGKGFYDIYLSENTINNTIALAFECQIFDKIVCSSYDIRPKMIITEETVYNGHI